jgi:hypothetical protein
MELKKTLNNLRLTKDSFFNLDAGSEVWLDILKKNILIKNNYLYVDGHGNFIEYINNLTNFKLVNVENEKFIKLINYDGTILSIIIKKGLFFRNCFLANGKN